MKKYLAIGLIIIGLLGLSGGGISTNDGSTLVGGVSNNVGTGIPITNQTADINISSAVTQQIIPATSSKVNYITHIHIIVGGASNVSIVYGTGSNCASSQQTIDGPLPLTASTGYSAGSGVGAVLVIPSGQAVCITSSSAVQLGGAVSWTTY